MTYYFYITSYNNMDLADSKNIDTRGVDALPEFTAQFNDQNIHTDNTIQHIVISGGGCMGFTYYGILREAHKHHLWHIENIQTIYGTSIGSIIATILCLDYDWNTLDNYLIKRPWEKVFHYDIQTLFTCVQNNGIFNRNITEQMLKPLLLGKDISIDITLADFYKITNIDLHIMVTNAIVFESVDISAKTHPKWSLIDAIHASCSIPILFKPIYLDNVIYCDGGFCVNYPINQSISNGANPDNTLGIQSISINNEDIDTTTFSLFDFILHLLNKLLNKIVDHRPCKIRHIFSVPIDMRSLSNITNVAEQQTVREEMIQLGCDIFHTQYTLN